MVATVRYADEVNRIGERLKTLRSVRSGIESMLALIDFWGNYIPVIYGLASALLNIRATDKAAAAAWDDRMAALQECCQNTITCLQRDGVHRPDLKGKKAADLLWSLLGIELWENLTMDCGWSTAEYIEAIKDLAIRTFVRESMAF
jgi:hypothetical protein